MNKVKNTIKNNSIFLLLIIPFIFVCMYNTPPNNDIWFLLTLGRYVFNSGIPFVEPFTIHSGLEYMMQQWMSASIFWGGFSIFGKYAVIGIILLMFLLLVFLFYKLCRIFVEKKISVILTTITFFMISTFIVNRPQIFTYFILLLEVFMLEKYINTKSSRWLYVLPFLSILLINLHSSMWYFQFIFLLPFIVNSIYIKNVTIDKFRIKPIIIVMILMILGGLINPYGLDALTFIFKSYGVDIINQYVVEMGSPSITGSYSSYMFYTLGMIFLLIIFMRYLKKFKLDIRHICFIMGTLFLYLNHIKCFPYFVFTFIYSIAYGLKKYDLSNLKLCIFDNKYIKAILGGVYKGILIVLFVSFILVSYNLVKYYSFNPTLSFNNDEDEIADFIVDNYDLDDVRLYCTYNEGGYYEYRGIKVYIDGKAEVFLKANNGKFDILQEALEVERDSSDYDYESFVNKYNFTHLIVGVDSDFKLYLDTDDRYEIVYTSNFNGEEGNPFRYVYSLKNELNS